MSKEKIKVYLYTRVSTTMQIDGYSLDAQKTKMKALTEWFTRRSALRGYLRIPLERNSLHASAGRLSAPSRCGCGIYGVELYRGACIQYARPCRCCQNGRPCCKRNDGFVNVNFSISVDSVV